MRRRNVHLLVSQSFWTPETDTDSGTGNSPSPLRCWGLPSHKSSHSHTPGNLDTQSHRDTARQGAWARTAPRQRPCHGVLTCTRPVVHSKNRHKQYRYHHLLHPEKNNFNSEPARLFLCPWGWQELLRTASLSHVTWLALSDWGSQLLKKK